MSTRSQVNRFSNEEIHSVTGGRKSLKLGFIDLVFLGMILISVGGFALEWLR